MIRVRRYLVDLTLKALDLTAMVVAFHLAAGSLVPGADWYSLHRLFEARFKVSNLLLFIGLLASWYVIFHAFGLYRSRRLVSTAEASLDIIKATSVGSMAVLGIGLLGDIQFVNSTFILPFWAVTTVLTISARMALRWVLVRFRIRGRNLRYILIVGTNNRALRFAEMIEGKPELGYRIRGFIDETWSEMDTFRETGWDLVGGFDDFGEYLRENAIAEVVIALPVSSFYQQLSRIVIACEEQGIVVHMLPDLFNLYHATVTVESLDDQPVITLRTGALDGWQLAAKRFVDVIASLAALILLMPVYVVIALLIKATSDGPVFFIQERVGLNKRRFPLFKFRTMVADAEERQRSLEELNEASGPVFKIANDPRITPLGKWLRKSSLDELPQLLNVLVGDMSIVGPRPLPVRDYEGFDSDSHRRRFSVRPGITCLWQVEGRSSIPFERWMELDMQYIDQWSLWLDFKILLSTVSAVVTGRGAG